MALVLKIGFSKNGKLSTFLGTIAPLFSRKAKSVMNWPLEQCAVVL